MKSKLMLFALVICVNSAIFADEQELKTIDLVIVAGQSNAVGFDAAPEKLPPSATDQHVHFWWRTGDPLPDEHDSTSQDQWTHLQAQPLGSPKKPREGRQYGNFAQPSGGFGPEIGLARDLVAAGAVVADQETNLAVLKVAFSGTSLARDWNPRGIGEEGACYRALIQELKLATASARDNGFELRPRGFFWVQGESDANANDAEVYAANFRRMLAELRREAGALSMPAFLAVNTKFSGGKNAFMPKIVQQQTMAAATDPYSEYVDTSSASIANNVHYDAAGTLQVGQMFAAALLRLEDRLRTPTPRLRIVTLGDSITKGVRAGVAKEETFAYLVEKSLNEQGVSAEVINVGIGGERTDQALTRLATIIELRPDVVTIMYGTNDSYVDKGKDASRISEQQYRDNLNRLVVQLIRNGIKPMLMTEPRWASNATENGIGENPNVKLEPFMDACREVASAWRLPLVDHFSAWTAASDAGTNLNDWTTDGCHPNAFGHQQLAQAIAKSILTRPSANLSTRQKLARGEKVKVVCFGDSVTGVYYHSGSRRAYTDMLGVALRRFAPNAEVEMVNAGLSGHTTANGLARISRDVVAKRPDLVTVMFGLNDITRLSLDEYKANLREIVARCRAAGAEVLLVTPNNIVDSPSRVTAKLVTYCDAVRELAVEENVALADVYQRFDAERQFDAFQWQQWMSDAIHPNMDGHQAVATALARSITGMKISLSDVEPQPLQILSYGKEKKLLRVIAMTPYDKIIQPILADRFPEADIQIVSWESNQTSIEQLQLAAKARVRQQKPDLVILTVPRTATAAEPALFSNAFAWVMNWSLNFGAPTWDCIVVHPSVTEISTGRDDELLRQLVRAQDLQLIDRPAGSQATAKELVESWFQSR